MRKTMIRILTAYTREIDDIEISVAEILEQLNLGERLLRNSVGILTFHSEFLETGAVKAISEALPFDSIGGTTSDATVAGVMAGKWGEPILTVAVLTSDDVVFRAGASAAIEGDPQAPVRELYARLAPLPTEKPALLLTFAPVMDDVGADDLIETLDAVSGGVPLFGALPSSHQSPEFISVSACYNGECGMNMLVLVAMFGDFDPEFVVSVIPDDRIMRQNSIVTGAVKNHIQEINGLTPIKYLESIGILAGSGSASFVGMVSIPFVLVLSDGSRVVRAAYKVTEEGHVLSFGTIPQNARIGFSDCDGDFVIQSAGETATRIAASSRARSALIFSCGARHWSLGTRVGAEMKELIKGLNSLHAYQFAYSFGEFCPVKNKNGQLVNGFHNFSIVACLL
jgi:hypothetical protein